MALRKLHYTKLRKLHYRQVCNMSNYITFEYIILDYTTSRYVTVHVRLHRSTLHHHYVTLNFSRYNDMYVPTSWPTSSNILQYNIRYIVEVLYRGMCNKKFLHTRHSCWWMSRKTGIFSWRTVFHWTGMAVQFCRPTSHCADFKTKNQYAETNVSC